MAPAQGAEAISAGARNASLIAARLRRAGLVNHGYAAAAKRVAQMSRVLLRGELPQQHAGVA